MSATRRRRELWMGPGPGIIPSRVLIVDDDRQVLNVLSQLLQTRGYDTACVADVAEARARLEVEPFHLILCDVRLPGESGLQFAQELVTSYPQIAVVMVSGLDEGDIAETALEIGVYDYILKPFSPSEVFISVANALRRRASSLDDEARRRQLSAVVAEQRAALADAGMALAEQERQLQSSRRETLYRLARVAEVRNEDMGDHMERVGRYTEVLARCLGLDDAQCEALRLASPLHDIGKIGLPDEVLLKPGRLDADELQMMRGHAEIGYALLADRDDELLDLAATIALTHHEHVDGGGYPRGLSDGQIPLESRIVAVADAFDAITSDRPYRPALSIGVALERISGAAGAQFDQGVVQALIDGIDEIVVAGGLDPAGMHPREGSGADVGKEAA
jgi:putative two-component system response regulator